jgi:hypothetical protein
LVKRPRDGHHVPQIPRPRTQHAYIPAPTYLPAFPNTVRVKPKGGRYQWKDKEGLIYESDSRHGTVEIYDRLGRHIGEFGHETGALRKRADRGRTVEP